ncbi:MAG: hypothetical protein JSS02_09740 [Planctomycetes bacterium]|nr:hypothetical protein [Planctomycetota bacterium]
MNTNVLTSTDCQVVVFAVPGDAGELATVLTAVLGLHPTDAMVQSRSAPGVLPGKLSREQAERLAAAIQNIGVRAEVASPEELADLEATEVVHHCRCVPAGLEIVDPRGVVQATIPWDEVDLISVGVVPQETGWHYPTGDMAILSAARRSPRTPLEIPATAGPEVWITCRSPFRSFRIDHKRMNYEYLGDCKTESATANFMLFLNDLMRHAPYAYVTPSTRAFLVHGPERLFHFDSTDQLRRYTQFHLLIHRHAG